MKNAIKEIRMVDLHGQYLNIKEEVDEAIQNVIDGSAFINGPAVKDFTLSLQKYLQIQHVIPCANGTDALQIALMALELEKGAEIIVPAFSFAAPAEVVALLGYTPIFADCTPGTFNVSVESLSKCITSRTRAIIAVHLFGQPADIHEINNLAKKHHLFLIEDNAQSLGAVCKTDTETTFAGTVGDFGTTSFFPSKNLGCMGDGGALFTNNAVLAEKARMIANHGQQKKYTHQLIGINSRLDSIQAAILNVKLKYLHSYIEKRIEAALLYFSLLRNCEHINLPDWHPNSGHVFNQFTIRVPEDTRDLLIDYLNAVGIPTMIYYPMPLQLQPVFRNLPYEKGDLPVSEKISKEVISLPMHTELDTVQLTYISNHVLKGIAAIQHKKVLYNL